VLFCLINAGAYGEKNQRVTARPMPSAHASLTRVGGSDLRPRGVSWQAMGEGEADEHAVGNSVVGELGGFAAGRACLNGSTRPSLAFAGACG
jgi:hypothetical protein